MKKIISSIVFLLFISSISFSQDNRAVTYIQFDLHKVEADKIQDYIKIEQDWKKVHEEEKKSGKVLRWMIYEVLLPSGTGVEYNYITVKIYKDYASLESIVPDMATAFNKVFPNKNFGEFYHSTDNIRKRLSTEIFENIDGYWNPNAFFQHKYARMDFMKTDMQNSGPYIDLEKNFFKPAHKVAIANGQMNGWQLCHKMYAANTDDYTDMTVNFYTDFAQTNATVSDLIANVKKAHPSLTDKQLSDKIAEVIKAREYRKVNLLKLIDSI
jgi:uncharacterized protein YxeA